IARRITWIGIKPTKQRVWHGHLVRFENFRHYRNGKGPILRDYARSLARRMYGQNARFVMAGMTQAEYEEADAMLALADGEPPSKGLRQANRRRKCGSTQC